MEELPEQGFFAETLYQKTGEQKYRDYAIQVGDVAYETAVKEDGKIHWDNLVDYMGDGSTAVYWLQLAEITGDQKYVTYAKELIDYILTFKKDLPDGTSYWRFFDIHDYFPELPAGGFFQISPMEPPVSYICLLNIMKRQKMDRIWILPKQALNF